MKYLLLLIFIGVGFSSWSPLATLSSSTTRVDAIDLYTDPKSGLSHFIFCRGINNQLTYIQFDYFLNVVLEKNITTPVVMQFAFSSKILGKGDGKSLLLCVNGAALHSSADIYCSESTDSGTTWGKFWTIPRDSQDKLSRSYPSILYIPETGRFFIFYYLRENKLAFVTRAAGSSVFTNERVIYNDPQFTQLTENLASSYSYVDRLMIVHLFWINVDSAKQRYTYYMNTSNNGVTWSGPIQLNDETPEKTESLGAVGVPSVSDKVVLTYKKTGYDSPLKMQYYTAKIKNWSEPLAFTESEQDIYQWEYKTNSMAICGNTAHPYLIALSQTEHTFMEFSVWDLKRMNAERYSHPFSTDYWIYGAYLGCSTNPANPEEIKVVAVIQQSMDFTHSKIFGAVYTFPIDPHYSRQSQYALTN
eukprot:TRINITY_DN91699_c0_g1_i1.p1 TRINITY_DN91699_c0_g1~~TRINITY_DN91699_c0_g1_i1.p1  ORF type:complete len:468 (+),score=-15.64 TRINITY_DN91699_c0_g1_i1:156-1406(+)